MKYAPIIGLEVHVELRTKSKMFCGCSADYFGKEPNTHVCPVCLGLPGALPAPNKTAIEWCIKIGLALNCDIPPFSKFDRKNYFYPDLPKGYQISQYDKPFCVNGSIRLSNGKMVGIRRVHMEEDTAKLIHQSQIPNLKSQISKSEKYSLIDFNRSGVPLVEIVTEPDFETAKEVVEYLKKLQQIVRYLEVSNADMEKGDMRLEPNISLREMNTTSKQTLPIPNDQLPNYKVEVKNINSFSFVERAINFEINRQTELLNKGEMPVQETRGWDDRKRKTISQRTKEEAHDYRYFPEPDIPPLAFNKSQISNLKSQIGELPEKKLERFQTEYKLSFYDSEILTREKALADYFEEVARVGNEHGINPKQIANLIINKKVDIETILPAKLVEMVLKLGKTEEVGAADLNKTLMEVFSENKKAVEEYKNGKEQALQFLIGQVVRKIGEKVDHNLVKNAILDRLK
ncbi:MAG: Asp-tRNA(Asn)/Glu-tRNA(Gln) amidotransferase subunit GatB [Candidatus Levybacteria bacterium]|nr:Asp-tRNA(Asn)/Glu-tRNA(Gln) amidotransferase subunit GatB [Candidatus Levybacteria bacterium]